MTMEQDDYLSIIKDEDIEEELLEEEMPSEIVHDNITEVIEMNFDNNMEYINDSQINIKELQYFVDGDVEEMENEEIIEQEDCVMDEEASIILQSESEALTLPPPPPPPPKLVPLSGIKLLNTIPGHVNSKRTITLAQAQQLGLVSTINKQPVVNKLPALATTNQNKFIVSKSIDGKQIILSPNQVNQLQSPIKWISSANDNVYGSSISNSSVGGSGSGGGGSTSSCSTLTSNTNSGTVEFLVKTPTGELKSMKHVIIRQPPTSTITSAPVSVSTPGTTITSSSSTLSTLSTTDSTGKVQIVKIIPAEALKSIKNEQSTESTNLRPVATTSTPNTFKLLSIPSGSKQVLAKTASGQQILIPISNNLTKLQTTHLLPQNTSTPNKANQQIIMLPTQYLQQSPSATASTTVTPTAPYRIQINNLQNNFSGQKFLKICPAEVKQDTQEDVSLVQADSYADSDDAESLAGSSVSQNQSNGLRQRKPCNCTKSQCLKLYCECFANGEFCNSCNCLNCFNNLKNEEERQKAIKSCLDRNPSAFRPKIGKMREIGEEINRKHTKGCNCKRSGCLKNYCECYEAKIFCSANCKCFGCRNLEENKLGNKALESIKTSSDTEDLDNKTDQIRKEYSSKPLSYYISLKPSTSFITDDVIEASCHCLLAQAEEATSRQTETEEIEKLIVTEFGRCLQEIINYTSTN